MKALNRMRLELIFFYRAGFIFAYLFVLIIYAAILLSVADLALRRSLSVLLIYSDISMLGFLFSAAALHLEVESGTVSALGVVPASSSRIMSVKVAALSLISLLIGAVMGAIGSRESINPFLFLTGSLICSVTFTSLGVSLTSRTRNLTRLLLASGLLTLPMALPLLRFFELLGSPLLLLLPGAGGLEFIARSIRPKPETEYETLLFAAVSSLVWVGLAFSLGARDLRRRLLQKDGEV